MANEVQIHVTAKDDASKRMAAVGASGKKMGASVGVAAAAAGAALLKFGADSVKAAQESIKVHNQTIAVLKSTGHAAKVTGADVEKLATAISNKTGIDDEAIQSGENLLLTFTRIRNETGKGNDIFNQATQTITDLSVAMGQDMKTSAVQVGKALNDPIKGMTALSRIGVTFTEQQKKQIVALEKSGHHLEAQKIILGELRKEFGGSAAAAATWADKAKVAFGNFQESIGKALLPQLNRAAKWFVKHQDDVAGFAGNIGDAAAAVGDLVSAIDKLGKGPLDKLMRSNKTGQKMGGGFKDFKDELTSLKAHSLRVFDAIAGAGAKLGLVPRKFADAVHRMRVEADSDLAKAKNRFNRTAEAINNKKIEAKLRADKKDLDRKLAAAKHALNDKNLTKERKAQLKAEIRQLIAAVARAKGAIASIHGKTVTVSMRVAKYHVNLKQPRGYAEGGIVSHAAEGGPRSNQVLVGEQGPELVDLPAGSHVNSNADTQRLMGQRGGGGGSVHITINAPNVTDRDGLRRMLVDMQRRGQLDVIRR